MTATVKCGITGLVLKELNKFLWGGNCNGDSEIGEAIAENYIDFLSCPTLDFAPCHSYKCDNPTKVFTCSLSAGSLDYTVASNQLDLTFFVQGGVTGALKPISYKWEYNSVHFTASSALNKETLTLRANTGIKWELISSKLKLTVTDADECKTTISCCLANKIMQCVDSCVLCDNTYDLRVSVIDLNCHPCDSLTVFNIKTN